MPQRPLPTDTEDHLPGQATTLGAALTWATRRLGAAGVARPRTDARLLLAAVAHGGAAAVLGYPERPLPAAAAARFATLVARRAAREPVSHLLGQREFWSLSFAISAAALDPRPDSETLVQAVLDRRADHAAPLRLLDLGTGSGCLLLALLHEMPAASGLGIDRSPAALALAQSNAERLDLAGRAHFQIGDWGRELSGPFDVIVANPPYIPTEAIATLAPEVARYEPHLALDGGADGLAAYRALSGDLARLLAPGGLVALEIGAGQAAAVLAIIQAAGLTPVAGGPVADLAGIDRCLLFQAADMKKTVGKAAASD